MSLLQFILVLATTSSFVSAHRFGQNGNGFGGSNSESAVAVTTSSSFDAASATTSALSFSSSTSSDNSDVDTSDVASTTTVGFSGNSDSPSVATTTSASLSQTTDSFGNNSGDQSTEAATTTSSGGDSSSSSAAGSKNAGNSQLVLDNNDLQAASDSDGQANEEAGQSPSITDPANFINFCGTTGQELTNGTQITEGSCNPVVMGQIPSKDNMISTIITNPKPGDTIQANQPFTVNIQVNNLEAGTFTNPNTTYYSAPQTLKGGKVVGHTHITIQSLGATLDSTTPPDPTTFAFFKGVNDDGNGQGGLSATVANGLDAGFYRVCTMTSASNHQPVLMPVAQRGAQDDCTKFFVGGGSSNTGTSGGNGNNNNNNGGNQNGGGSDKVVQDSQRQYGGRRLRRFKS